MIITLVCICILNVVCRSNGARTTMTTIAISRFDVALLITRLALTVSFAATQI